MDVFPTPLAVLTSNLRNPCQGVDFAFANFNANMHDLHPGGWWVGLKRNQIIIEIIVFVVYLFICLLLMFNYFVCSISFVLLVLKNTCFCFLVDSTRFSPVDFVLLEFLSIRFLNSSWLCWRSLIAIAIDKGPFIPSPHLYCIC